MTKNTMEGVLSSPPGLFQVGSTYIWEKNIQKYFSDLLVYLRIVVIHLKIIIFENVYTPIPSGFECTELAISSTDLFRSPDSFAQDFQSFVSCWHVQQFSLDSILDFLKCFSYGQQGMYYIYIYIYIYIYKYIYVYMRKCFIDMMGLFPWGVGSYLSRGMTRAHA